MTRYIAILTLALTAGFSPGKASAQQASAVPLLSSSMANTAESSLDQMGGMLMRTDSATDDCSSLEINGFSSVPYTEHFQGKSVIPVNDAYFPDDDGNTIGCGPYLFILDDMPFLELGGQQGDNLVALWLEVVDAGLTEHEAFEIIRMLSDEDGWLVGGGYKLSDWVYDEE